MSTPHIQLRGYMPSDLAAIYELDQVCFGEPFRFSYAEMRRLAEAKNSRTIIADVSSKLAGFCMVSFDRHAPANHAYLSTIDVDPVYRGSGIGHLLLSEAERESLQAHCTAMWLHVYVQNAAAISLYEREGYLLLHPQKDFYGAGLDALVYAKELSATVLPSGEAPLKASS